MKIIKLKISNEDARKKLDSDIQKAGYKQGIDYTWFIKLAKWTFQLEISHIEICNSYMLQDTKIKELLLEYLL